MLFDLIAGLLSAVGGLGATVLGCLVLYRKHFPRHCAPAAPEIDYVALSAQLTPEDREWLRSMGAEWVVEPEPVSLTKVPKPKPNSALTSFLRMTQEPLCRPCNDVRKYTAADIRNMSMAEYAAARPALLRSAALPVVADMLEHERTVGVPITKTQQPS